MFESHKTTLDRKYRNPQFNSQTFEAETIDPSMFKQFSEMDLIPSELEQILDSTSMPISPLSGMESSGSSESLRQILSPIKTKLPKFPTNTTRFRDDEDDVLVSGKTTDSSTLPDIDML